MQMFIKPKKTTSQVIYRSLVFSEKCINTLMVLNLQLSLWSLDCWGRPKCYYVYFHADVTMFELSN